MGIECFIHKNLALHSVMVLVSGQNARSGLEITKIGEIPPMLMGSLLSHCELLFHSLTLDLLCQQISTQNKAYQLLHQHITGHNIAVKLEDVPL